MRNAILAALCLCLAGSGAGLAQENKDKQKQKGKERKVERRVQTRTDNRDRRNPVLRDTRRRDGSRREDGRRLDDRWDDRYERVLITPNHHTYRYSGQNRVYEVRGSGIRVRITGDIRGIIVTGSNNTVIADDVDYITVRGHNNTVAYSDGLRSEDPRITRSGNNNRIYDRT